MNRVCRALADREGRRHARGGEERLFNDGWRLTWWPERDARRVVPGNGETERSYRVAPKTLKQDWSCATRKLGWRAVAQLTAWYGRRTDEKRSSPRSPEIYEDRGSRNFDDRTCSKIPGAADFRKSLCT